MSNLTENKLNVVLTAADVTAINTNVNTINAKLPIGSLNEDQRANYKAIDVGNKVFSEDVVTELAISGAGIMPAFINGAFIQTDLSFFEQMDALEANLMNTVQRVRDLKRIAGHEAYSMSLAVYKIYECANAAGIPGAKQAYDKLKARFDAQGRPSDGTEA